MAKAKEELVVNGTLGKEFEFEKVPEFVAAADMLNQDIRKIPDEAWSYFKEGKFAHRELILSLLYEKEGISIPGDRIPVAKMEVMRHGDLKIFLAHGTYEKGSLSVESDEYVIVKLYRDRMEDNFFSVLYSTGKYYFPWDTPYLKKIVAAFLFAQLAIMTPSKVKFFDDGVWRGPSNYSYRPPKGKRKVAKEKNDHGGHNRKPVEGRISCWVRAPYFRHVRGKLVWVRETLCTRKGMTPTEQDIADAYVRYHKRCYVS